MTTRALAMLPVARLARSRAGWLTMAGWAGLAIARAAFERERGHGADGALLGTFGAIALPLMAFGIVSTILAGGSLGAAIRPLTAFGAPPSRAASVTVLTAMATSAVALGALAFVVTATAGSADLPLDLVTSTWIGALAGATYAAYFAMASSFGRSGGGRIAFLLLDYLLGAGDHAAALFVPRGNVRGLLGGASPADVSQRVNSLLLFAIALASLAVCARRARR